MTVKDGASYELFKTTPKDPHGELVETVRGLKKAEARAAYLSRGHRNDGIKYVIRAKSAVGHQRLSFGK